MPSGTTRPHALQTNLVLDRVHYKRKHALDIGLYRFVYTHNYQFQFGVRLRSACGLVSVICVRYMMSMLSCRQSAYFFNFVLFILHRYSNKSVDQLCKCNAVVDPHCRFALRGKLSTPIGPLHVFSIDGGSLRLQNIVVK